MWTLHLVIRDWVHPDFIVVATRERLSCLILQYGGQPKLTDRRSHLVVHSILLPFLSAFCCSLLVFLLSFDPVAPSAGLMPLTAQAGLSNFDL